MRPAQLIATHDRQRTSRAWMASVQKASTLLHLHISILALSQCRALGHHHRQSLGTMLQRPIACRGDHGRMPSAIDALYHQAARAPCSQAQRI